MIIYDRDHKINGYIVLNLKTYHKIKYYEIYYIILRCTFEHTTEV